MGDLESTFSREEGLIPVPAVWFKLGFFLFLAVWLSYLLYEAWGWESSEDYLFAYILAPVIVVLLLYRSALLISPDRLQRLTARLEFLDTDGANAPGDETEALPESPARGRESKAEEERYAIAMILWTAALPVGMFLFGMAWSLPVFLFGFTWFFTRNKRRAALVTVLAVAFIYLLFIEILNVLLWTGYLGLPNPLEYLP